MHELSSTLFHFTEHRPLPDVQCTMTVHNYSELKLKLIATMYLAF